MHNDAHVLILFSFFDQTEQFENKDAKCKMVLSDGI